MKEQKNLAHVAVNKSRVKEYSNYDCNRIVYLDNGTEFQLEFFNPYHYTIGITFAFDEKFGTSRMIVLKPGERVWLDRYLDSPKKFLFSTYEVEDLKEAKEAISENGNVTIKFYKEKEKDYYLGTTTLKVSGNSWEPSTWDSHYYSSGQYSAQQNLSCNYCASTGNSLKSCGNLDDFIQTSASTMFNDSTIETGRVEEGSYSNQTFETVYNEFENYPFATERIKILPTSRKPISKSDIQRKFCYNCGRKIKDKFKFCPNCGAKQ